MNFEFLVFSGKSQTSASQQDLGLGFSHNDNNKFDYRSFQGTIGLAKVEKKGTRKLIL